MSPRPRRVVTGLMLSGALVFSLLGVMSSGASLATSGKVSAHLTKTSLTAAQAGNVKLVCKFSPASTRWGYLLSLKKGAKWAKVRSVNKTGSFKGSYTMTVKKLFGSKPVKVGQYRVKVSADANSVTRSFKVVKATSGAGSGGGSGGGGSGGGGSGGGSNTTPPLPGAFNKTSPANGATSQPTNPSLSWGTGSNAASYEYCLDTTNNNACDGSWVSTNSATSASLSGLVFGTTYYWQVQAKNAQGTTYADGGSWFSFRVSAPLAGYWLTAPGGVSFYVTPDQTAITHFDIPYDVVFITTRCTGDVWSASLTPIVNAQFSDKTFLGNFSFSGTFDSPSSAHGTAALSAYPISGCGFVNEGPISWTATWQDASQPS